MAVKSLESKASLGTWAWVSAPMTLKVLLPPGPGLLGSSSLTSWVRQPGVPLVTFEMVHLKELPNIKGKFGQAVPAAVSSMHSLPDYYSFCFKIWTGNIFGYKSGNEWAGIFC